MHRIHKHKLDRALCWLVPVNRYRCSNWNCRWEGLLPRRDTPAPWQTELASMVLNFQNPKPKPLRGRYSR